MGLGRGIVGVGDGVPEVDRAAVPRSPKNTLTRVRPAVVSVAPPTLGSAPSQNCLGSGLPGSLKLYRSVGPSLFG